MNNFLKIVAAIACVAALTSSPAMAQSATISKIKARSSLICAVPTTPYPGFFEVGNNGDWHGFDVDICKSIASAILGPNAKVTFSPVSWADRIPALQSGTLDLIAMITGWTRSRDVKLGLQFSTPYFFGGNRVMVPTALHIKSVRQLNGATFCVTAGSSNTPQLVSYLSSFKLHYKMLNFETSSAAAAAYQNKRCDALSSTGASLAALLVSMLKPTENVILPEVISMEPEAVVMRQGDHTFLGVVNWTIAALVEAQRLGITKENVNAKRSDPQSSSEVKFLLGVTPGVGSGMGLPDTWAYDVIKANGNYGEIYDRNLGKNSLYKLPAGQNAVWTRGGLLYSPIFD